MSRQMKEALCISDSLVASLCREIDYLRKRYSSIILSLENCKNISLKKRLKEELQNLKYRKEELSNVCNFIVKGNKNIDLSIIFLIELCNRPLGYQLLS